MYNKPRKTKGGYKFQEAAGINHIEAVPVIAYTENGKEYGKYRTMRLAAAYTGASRNKIARSIAEDVYTDTRKGKLKFKILNTNEQV